MLVCPICRRGEGKSARLPILWRPCRWCRWKRRITGAATMLLTLAVLLGMAWALWNYLGAG